MLSEAAEDYRRELGKEVLILVLMEYALWVFKKMVKISFNES